MSKNTDEEFQETILHKPAVVPITQPVLFPNALIKSWQKQTAAKLTSSNRANDQSETSDSQNNSEKTVVDSDHSENGAPGLPKCPDKVQRMLFTPAAVLKKMCTKAGVNYFASLDEVIKKYKETYVTAARLKRSIKLAKQNASAATTKARKKMAQMEKRLKKAIVDKSTVEHAPKPKRKLEVSTKKEVANIGEILTHLKEERFLSDSAVENMEKMLGSSLQEPVPYSNTPTKRVKFKNRNYTPVMKAFAKNLLFYSCQAYCYVKETYYIQFPPIGTTRSWFSTSKDQPGWSCDSFLFIKEEVHRNEMKSLHCSISMGEIDLSPGLEIQGDSFIGHIDYGTTGDLNTVCVNSLPLAEKALVFMATALDPEKQWSISLGYFLIDSLTSEEKANVLLECLWRVFNMGSVVVSVVVDAKPNSRKMLSHLGIQFDQLPHPSTSFPHPANGLCSVQVYFDPCNLMTLARHTWASVGVLLDESGGKINWNCFTELVKVLKNKAGIAKSDDDHIATWYWDKKMVVQRLVAQALTIEVADALESSSTLSQFTNCKPTIAFIRMMSEIFSLCTSNVCLPGKENFAQWRTSVMQALNYLLVLRDRSSQGLFATNCKIPFVCMYMNLMNLLLLQQVYPSCKVKCLTLNHLYLMFLAMHRGLKFGSVPNISDFVSAYTAYSHDQRKGLSFSYLSCTTREELWFDTADLNSIHREEVYLTHQFQSLKPVSNVNSNFTFYPVFLRKDLCRFRESQLVLVNTIKDVAKTLICSVCLAGLQTQCDIDDPTVVLLSKICGGVIHPSRGVVVVCSSAERNLRIILRSQSTSDKEHYLYKSNNSALLRKICISVMEDIVNSSVPPFPDLDSHFKESGFVGDHFVRLVYALIKSYVKLRIKPVRAFCIMS